MLILVIAAVIAAVIAIAFVAILRHSRNFRGYAEHYADEERPDLKLSKALGPPDGG